MKIEKFEDILAWQKTNNLSVKIYRAFVKNRDFGFRDQICKASVSIMNNVAEGFERNSDKELRRFLLIAKGSCGEVRSMLHLAKQLSYISPADFEKLHFETIEISKLLGGFIRMLDN